MITDRPSAEWDVYFTRMRDKPASIMVDFSLHRIAPLASHPRLFVVQILMQRPNDNGLPSREESDQGLYPIEDAVVPAIQNADTQAIHVGKLTSDGLVSHYFYCPPHNADDGMETPAEGPAAGQGRPSLSDRLDRAMMGCPVYKYDCYERDEPNWYAYLHLLYPGEWELQTILNAKLLRNMKSRGDRTDQPREIDHLIRCPDADAQEAVAAGGEALGFRAERSASSGEGDFCVSLYRIDVPDRIDGIMLPLFELARQHGAHYDGWGSVAVQA